MFRSSRWRSEKKKIKSVFKLQFHATQVSQLVVEALMISVVPVDVGKPTVRLEKVSVEEGSFRWANPVYETVNFFQDPKTGKINERLYRFIVSTGSSKGGFVGDVSIDFADYVEATKASTISLPLKNSKSNIVLHISIQRLQENVDLREIQDCEDTVSMPLDRSLRTQLSSGDSDENIKTDFVEDVPIMKTTPHVQVNGNCRASSGSDITLSSSESSSGNDTPREFESSNNNNSQNPTAVVSSLNHASMPQKEAANARNTFIEENQRTQWEWSGGSDLGMSTDESTNGFHDSVPKERSQQASNFEIEKLKSELVALARQVDVSELELQTLRKQIIKETKRGQDLSREAIILKEERDAFKRECEKFKSLQKRTEEANSKNKLQYEGGDPRARIDEVREELNYEKDLNANLRLQLQKTQESNAELIFAVQDLEDMLEQKNKLSLNLSKKSGSCENAEELGGTISRSETDSDEEQKALEELVGGRRDAKEAYLLEQKVLDLQNEIQIYKRDKDELEMQMEQLALDYEILKQENHDITYKLEQSELQEQLKFQYECSSSFTNVIELEGQIEKLENELKKQSQQYSDSLATISALESHIESLEEEMDKQAQVFESDLEAVTNAKVEQEQRAIRAEEALRTAKWKNANTAERLQEEFKKLSVQMASTFDANEKVAMKALTEASELRLQKTTLEEMLQKANGELQLVTEDYEAKFCDLSNQLKAKTNHVEQTMLEIDDKLKELERQRKHEEAVTGALSEEILGLRAEIERLAKVNTILSEKAEQTEKLRDELKQMKASIDEADMLVQRGNVERNELLSTIALAQKEAETSLEELNQMKSIKVEKEKEVEGLRSELDTFKSQCNDLKHSLFEDETEKEKLRKQVFQLKGDLKKKEEAFNSIEKKLKDSTNRRPTNCDATKITPRNNKLSQVSNSSKEVANLRDKIKLLGGQIKLKENALETSTNLFLEKERDLLNKIEELESRVDELRHCSTELCAYEVRKGDEEFVCVSLNDSTTEEVRTADGYLNSTACKSGECRNAKTSLKRYELRKKIQSGEDLSAKREMNVYASNNRDCNVNELLTEIVSLKERNDTMESELKEMQERYSDVSLKFAEVEGERQQLVMTVRNLKNSMKN